MKPRDPFGFKMCSTKVYCVLYCTHYVQQCSEQLTAAGKLVREYQFSERVGRGNLELIPALRGNFQKMWINVSAVT